MTGLTIRPVLYPRGVRIRGPGGRSAVGYRVGALTVAGAADELGSRGLSTLAPRA